MIVLIPMGGQGTRFYNAGYTTNKPCILTTDRHSGKKLPMILCAMKDIPNIQEKKNQIICVDRSFHRENGTEKIIRDHFPKTIFIHDHVLLDQAFACFLAREFLQSDDELFIGSCDNGMVYNQRDFEAAKKKADVLMMSHSNDANIARNPQAHSWAKLKHVNSRDISALFFKTVVSEQPMQDHATIGMFWFRHANIFLKHLESMIWQQDLVDGKYYVDKVLQYCIDAKLTVQYFDVKYICWGTPEDYEEYEKTIDYWQSFIKQEGSLR